MKNLILTILTFTSITSFASDDCKDKNLKNIKGVDYYNQLQYLNRFEKVFEVDTTAPAGFDDMFGEGNDICRDVTATYLKHTSGTIYVMYTTNDDYCDGGNTSGIMINMDKYMDEESKLNDSVVGEISDSDFICN